MKKLLCLLSICLAVNGYGQKKPLSKDYTYKVSEPYKVFDAKKKYYFAESNEAMALKFDGDNINIQKFNTDKPSLIKEKLYDKFLPKNYAVEGVEVVDGKYYVFFSSWDGDNDKEQLFAIGVDFATGEFVGTPKLLFQVNGKVAGTMAQASGFMSFSIGVVDKFEVLQSYDKKNILVEYRKKPEVKNDKKSFDIIGLYAFDGNLNKLSGHEVTMPYTERRMNNLDYQLDNKGTLYLLAKVYHDDSNDDKKKKKDTIANYHVEMLSIKQGTDKVVVSKFENNDKFVNKLWIFDTDKDYLICGGLFSNGKGLKRRSGFMLANNHHYNSYDDSDGIVIMKVHPDGSMYDQVYYDIPVEILNEYESAKTKKKNAKQEEKGESAKFADLELKDLSIDSAGNIILIGEQTYKIWHNRNGGGGFGMGGGGFGMGGNGYYTYHYDDILVSKITADGQLAWMKKIPKTQFGAQGKGGMSYKYFNANNSHYFVFLDNIKNIDLPLEKEPAIHSDGQGGYLTAVKISDSDGTLKKGSILNAREVEDFGIYQFATGRVFKTGEGSFMLEAYKKKKEDIMVKVTLN
jgi:hypothetical protein